MSNIVKQGWCEKCGPKRCPTWNKRWLVLYDTRVLEYFRNDNKTDLKGVIELSGKETIKLAGDPGKTFDHGFYLETPTRTYKFAVSSSSDKQEWCDLIKQVINGHIRVNGNIYNKKRTTSTVPDKISKHVLSPRTISGRKPRAQSSPMSFVILAHSRHVVITLYIILISRNKKCEQFLFIIIKWKNGIERGL